MHSLYSQNVQFCHIHTIVCVVFFYICRLTILRYRNMCMQLFYKDMKIEISECASAKTLSC